MKNIEFVLRKFPELNGSLWRIRKFKMKDLQLIQKVSSDPLIPLITSVPANFSEEAGKGYIRRQWSRYDQGTGYSLAIAERDTDQAIGSVYLGLHNVEDGRVSAGYWIVEDFRGKGVAKFALKEVVAWAQSELQVPRIELCVEPWNIASIKTAEAVGFKKEGIMRSWQQVGNERKDMIMMSVIT
jgi:RimJ/RimL family protein N-acetyltransferase